MKAYLELIYNGIVKENPALILMLGMCPTLAVTTSASNGLGMGLSTMAVLVLANLLISLLRKIIPDDVRLPAFIVVVASLVTVVEMITQAYMSALYESLGLYIPLIVVNCIILGRAEAFASKNGPVASIFDGDIVMSIGLDLEGLVTGIEFTEISETAGMGMRVTEAEFKDQFLGAAVDSFVGNKAGGSTEPNQIDSVSGATISSRAVTNAVNAARHFFLENMK